jgi:hypothetical protein
MNFSRIIRKLFTRRKSSLLPKPRPLAQAEFEASLERFLQWQAEREKSNLHKNQ